jgi:hypothetical protein
VAFGIDKEKLQVHRRTKDIVGSIHICDHGQVFVWSQESRLEGDKTPSAATTTATRFVMTPHHKGTIERYTTPDRLSPLVTSGASKEGVACHGEPSIDPSRAVHNQLGDSEWLQEFQGN